MENWEQINAVQRVQDYILKHITEEITLHGLAQVAGYSPWYTSRIFKELVGRPPLEYIRALRLSHAALKLRDEKIKVVDVALDFAFNSHEGFTRAFSQEFGMTPKHYQKGTPPIPLFMPSSIREYYLIIKKGEVKKMEKVKNNIIFTQVVERPARKLILQRGIKAENYFDYCEEVGCDVWGILCSIKEALYEPIGMWLPENLRKKGTSEYAQGVEVPIDYKGEVPAGFEVIELSPCKVMVFQGAPFNNEEFGAAIAELWEAMKEYNPELYGFKWADEDGPRFQLVPLGERGYIEARPVRSLKQD